MLAKEKMFILLVEDDILISKVTAKFLRNLEYEVSAELDGKLALDFLKKTDKLPHLIISDIMMPNMNGIEFLEHLKECRDFEPIPVFAITALEKEEIYAKTNYSFDRIFQKPFSLQELSEAIEQKLKKLTS